MPPFNPEDYIAPIANLLALNPLPPLGPGTPQESVRPQLKALRPETLFPNGSNKTFAQSCISGLWLLFNFLDESHTISQEIDTPTGSFWHAIMHRREPDPSNAKYWFRLVGLHPVLKLLEEQAPSVGYKFTDPFTFIDFVERARGSGSADEETAKRVQLLEWKLLFEWCFERAGKP